MKRFILDKYENILLVLIIAMMCITRMSMAIGNVLYGLILLVTLIVLILKRNKIYISKDLKSYGVMYLFLLICIVPSVFASDDITRSFKYFINIWIWKTLIVIPILFLIKSKSKLFNLIVAFFIFMGLDSISAYIQYLAEFRVSDSRAGGSIVGSVMGFAMLITLGFPLSLIAMFDESLPVKVRRYAAFSMTSILFGMWGNQSRGSWLFNGINGALIIIYYLRKNLKYLIIAICTMGIIGGIFSQSTNHTDRIKTTFDTTKVESNYGRLYVWNSDINMIKDSPLFGVGPGMWLEKYNTKYKIPEETQNLGHSHNNIMQITSESGIVGLTGFIIFSIFVLITSFKDYLQKQNPYDLSIVVGYISFIFLFGMIDYTWGNSSGIRIFWIIMSTLLALKIYY